VLYVLAVKYITASALCTRRYALIRALYAFLFHCVRQINSSRHRSVIFYLDTVQSIRIVFLSRSRQ